MKLIPVLTEKSLGQAKEGNYTFWVDRRMNKYQIKQAVEKIFDVNVVKVRTINLKGEVKQSYFGKRKVIKPRKKAIVTLKEKQKIDLFEVKE
jgi:large subunit ribosomal protein L23